MITVKLLTYPSGATTWEILRGETSHEVETSIPKQEVPTFTQGTKILIYKVTEPVWVWESGSSAPDGSTLEVDPRKGIVCAVKEEAEVTKAGVLDSRSFLLAGAILAIPLLMLGLRRKRG